MKYFLKRSPSPLPGMFWQAQKSDLGWWQASIYSGNTIIGAYGPLPTPAMVLSAMRKNGYEPIDDDMPDDWQIPPRDGLSTKEVTTLLGLKGNRVASACKKGSLKASLGGDGEYFIHEEDAAEWYLMSLRHDKKTRKNSKPCPRCATQMVKDGTGKAPSICPACYWPRQRS